MKTIKQVKQRFLSKKLEDILITILGFDLETNELIEFCIIQIYVPQGEKSYQIIKYDTSHQKCHVHRYYKNLKAVQEKISSSEISKHLFYRLKEDIEKNWKKYKEWYCSKWLS